MKLYTSPGACSTADHIVLQWLGQPYEFQIVTREQRATPSTAPSNPSGAVPALQVGELGADPELRDPALPDGPLSRNRPVRRWRRAKPRRGQPLAGLRQCRCAPGVQTTIGATHYLEDQAAIDKSHANARAQLRGLFANADAQLEGKDWITGSRSIADPYLFITLQWAKKTGVDLSGLDNLARFDAHMANDAGVRAAVKAEGLDLSRNPGRHSCNKKPRNAWLLVWPQTELALCDRHKHLVFRAHVIGRRTDDLAVDTLFDDVRAQPAVRANTSNGVKKERVFTLVPCRLIRLPLL